MANIILPAVPVLSEINDSTKILIEQAGEINRYPISDLDIGGGDVTIDLNAPGGSGIGNSINADTLGGKPASDYVLKDELILDNNGSNLAVLYVKQTLTDAQKLQARANIGAASVADVIAALPLAKEVAF